MIIDQVGNCTNTSAELSAYTIKGKRVQRGSMEGAVWLNVACRSAVRQARVRFPSGSPPSSQLSKFITKSRRSKISRRVILQCTVAIVYFWWVLLHNGGFWNNSIPKRCLYSVHIGAFPKKCTIKQPFHTTATRKVWKFIKASSFCPVTTINKK